MCTVQGGWGVGVGGVFAEGGKRPRGLDVLLGYLLVKRIPVLYKRSSTNSP